MTGVNAATPAPAKKRIMTQSTTVTSPIGIRARALLGSRGWHMIDEIDLVRLIAEHSAWLRLSARLEAIADALPELPDTDEILLLRAQIDGLTRARPDASEDVLDRLLERDKGRPLACSLLQGFHAARTARLIDADDIVLALEAAAGTDTPFAATALGYMLRSFFQGCRKAVALEQLSLLAVSNERLTADARALLSERLTQTCARA